MIALIIGLCVSMVSSFLLTPLTIRIVHHLNYGQYIRQDGPKSHLLKRGTPTMGGIAIILSTILGWGASLLYRYVSYGSVPSVSALLVLFCMVAFGALGFVDDFLKVAKKQNLGLSIHAKFIGQFLIATVYAILAVLLPTKSGFPAARMSIAFIETPVISLEFAGRVVGVILFVIWVNFLMTAWTNAINLTDGLDGLAAGSSMVAFVGFGLIAFWQSTHVQGSKASGFLYAVSDPQDIAIIAVCAVCACFGFLWYNTNPAKIFMGDTGSLALGGLFAAMSVSLHVELLAIILGGLFVIETVSDVLQIASFHLTGKRIFKMAPLHHHYELKGWHENTVVVRFWMLEIGFMIISVIIFYADWLIRSGQLG
ncbi:MAG: phospho-N-acetylmuramoyl-pentapeptide-transferase [Bifidobacteriaceae bacterium]|jgi:phospho-N-acetylmuramoyl-pentapeptide-transferase|nr:phospho-N-acetylmuramoyl-pentapeptide-transferase [Bifidobacteriaceae bacterium]